MKLSLLVALCGAVLATGVHTDDCTPENLEQCTTFIKGYVRYTFPHYFQGRREYDIFCSGNYLYESCTDKLTNCSDALNGTLAGQRAGYAYMCMHDSVLGFSPCFRNVTYVVEEQCNKTADRCDVMVDNLRCWHNTVEAMCGEQAAEYAHNVSQLMLQPSWQGCDLSDLSVSGAVKVTPPWTATLFLGVLAAMAALKATAM